MGKINFIFNEFFRSFQKGLIKNILLMIMFSICIIMVVLMSSYYLDLGEREDYIASNYDENGTWYNISIEDIDCFEFEKYLSTTKGSQNVMNYYEKICNIESHPIMSVNTTQNILLIEDECKKLMSDEKMRMFQPFDSNGSIGGEIDGVSATYKIFKSAQFDANAYEYFGLKTSMGEGFTPDNTTLNNAMEEIPIVLGSNYTGLIDVGKKLRIAIDGSDYLFNCKVVGILEAGTRVYDFGKSDQELISLDSYIVFPYGIHLDFETDDNDILARYSYLNYRALWNSQIILSYNTEFREMVELFGELGREYNLPPLTLTGASMGQKLFRKETAGSIKIMLIISVCLVCFTLYSLFMMIYNKIRSNQEIYGIYLMNGCSTSMILIPFMMEIGVIIIPSLLVSRYLFREEMFMMYFNCDAILNAVYLLIVIAYLLGVLFLFCLMRNVDTELLIKKGD
ncbi:MAG: hypothetical protein E7265_10805 [Lachnospiraceae bacterium]|nr:hypothetical protein [Lachnospiraceae bacterium]